MRTELKDFQAYYLEELVDSLRLASSEVASAGRLQAVSLSAPTGSGKTMMATAAIERIFCGDDDDAKNPRPADPNAVVLWITDQPELNLQTLEKMEGSASLLDPGALVEIDEDFVQQTFEPAHVYFLNTQKLGSATNYVKRHDKRNCTLWETIANTATDSSASFYVFIDEAHRGMSESDKDRKTATTIIQKFIKGSPDDGLEPIPLIFGLSATSQRFQALITGTGRTTRPVDVDAKAVRESGLIKDKIILFHPEKNAPTELTLLRSAATKLVDYETQWDAYTDAQGLPRVHPLLVVQVADGKKTKTTTSVSATDLTAALGQVEAVLGPLGDEQVAHAFDSHTPLDFGDRRVRYVAPSQIAGQAALKVVFFKKSLNTGWDCPRAEVMMSFRTANDAIEIAQLVGRMVRTPRAERIDRVEHLNSVAVCLPNYDAAEIAAVVKVLTNPENSAHDEDDIVKGSSLVKLHRLTSRKGLNSKELFDIIEALPNYVVRKRPGGSQVTRLGRLARRLSLDEIDPTAPDKATEHLIAVVSSTFAAKSKTKAFRDLLAHANEVPVAAVEWVHGPEAVPGTTENMVVTDADLKLIFDQFGNKLGPFYKEWWRKRVEDDHLAPNDARREFVALSVDPKLRLTVESAAAGLVEDWLKKTKVKRKALNDEAKREYYDISSAAPTPQLVDLELKEEADAVTDGATFYDKHLFVDDAGRYPAKLGGWEDPVIQEEIAREDVVAWLRNPPNSKNGLCIAYKDAGKPRSLYPDFLILRRENGNVVVDIVDPHGTHLPEAPAKAAGLAEYAEQYGEHFGRIELIVLDKASGAIARLDLLDDAELRREVKGVSTRQHLEGLYNRFKVLNPGG